VGEEEHRGKQHGDDPGSNVDLLDLTGECLDGNIRDQTERNAIGDVIGKGHHRDGQEGRQCHGGICPIDILDADDHQNTDVNESRAVCAGRDERRNGREEKRDEEHGSGDQGGKTGTASRADTRRRLHKGGDGGGAADSTRAGCNGIGKHGAIHVGNLVLSLLVLHEQIAAAASTVKRAHGIKHIHHTECKCGGDEGNDQAADAVALLRKICVKIKAFGKDLTECLRAEFTEGIDRVERNTVKETDIEITLKSADEIYDTYGSITYTCDLSAYPMDNFCHWDGRIVLVEEDRLLVSPGGKQAKIEFGEVVWLIWDGAFAYSVGQYVDYSFQNVIAPENEGEPLNIIATTVCIP